LYRPFRLNSLENLTWLLERYSRQPESEIRKLLVHVALKRQSQIEAEIARRQKAYEQSKEVMIVFGW
jgi:hypothetical protein